jgi:hypothetical protein
MSKNIPPQMGVPAKEATENLITGFENRGSWVATKLGEALPFINPDVCLTPDQIKALKGSERWVDQPNCLDFVSAINSLRLDCRNCLNENCPQRDHESPLEQVKKGK